MFLYRQIMWWPSAFHVFEKDFSSKNRIGIVNSKIVRIKGQSMRVRWFAHNVHFLTVPGEFTTQREAAEAIPTGPIHQPVEAFS